MRIKYIQLIDPEYRNKIRETFDQDTGTYVLHLFENGKPKMISRFLKTDNTGILYIGKTNGPLHKRVGKDLKDSIIYNSNPKQKEPNIKGHSQLSQKFYRVRLHIQIEDLYIDLSNEFEDSTLREESRMIEEYVSEFGELPPFNGSYGGETHWKLYQNLKQ